MFRGEIRIGQRFFHTVFNLFCSLFEFHRAKLSYNGLRLFTSGFLAFLRVNRFEHLGHQFDLGFWDHREHIAIEMNPTALILCLWKHLSI